MSLDINPEVFITCPLEQSECYGCGVRISVGEYKYWIGVIRQKGQWNCKECDNYGKQEENRMEGIQDPV